MRAALYRRTGTASDVLEVVDLPVPAPGPGEVLVRISASAINPTDWKQRAGITGKDPEDFQVPHHDGVGRVEAVGPQVTGLAVGQRVWLHLAAFGNPYGTAAEYVVLVAGGAGAVGHYAIELAKHAGARVVTIVSSGAKAELARAAGADVVLDYTTGDVAARVLGSVGPVDRIVEVAPAANIGLDVAVAAPGAVISVYAVEQEEPRLPVAPLATANVTIRFVLLYTVPDAARAAAIAWTTAAVDAGALTPLPITAYALDDVVAAQKAVESGAVGKVVLRP